MSVLRELTINRFFTYVTAGALIIEQLRSGDLEHKTLPALGLMVIASLTAGFAVEATGRIIGSLFKHPSNHKPGETFRQKYWDLT